MIQIYGNPRTRTIRALWAAEEAGVEYENIFIDLSKKDNRQPEFLKLNPSGKIPVLVDGKLILTESGAICQYLGLKKPELGLTLPLSHPERPFFDQWMLYACAELEQGLWNISKHTFVHAQEYRIDAMQRVGLWEFKTAEAIVADHLQGQEYMLACGFTVVDIMVSQVFMWAKSIGIELASPCEKYMKAMRSRPAFGRLKEKFLK